MSLWDNLIGVRKFLKKIKIIYIPYRNIKVYFINKKKIKELHKNGADTINEVENALQNYNITYFADYGTLLGIIRDKQFIKWDNDLDYAIIYNPEFDWKHFESHMNKYGFSKIREFSLDNLITEQTYSNNILTVDFFAKYQEGTELVSYGIYRKKDYTYTSDLEYHFTKVRYSNVTSVKKVPFLGISVTVPVNSEEYLESIYSKNWRIPDPTWSAENSDIKIEWLDKLGTAMIIR